MRPLGGRAVVVGVGSRVSCSRPGMCRRAITGAIGQLRRACGERRVAGCASAIAHANGGVFSSQAATILGGAATV